MKQHIIILLILFIIISLYNQCNKKNLNKLQNKATNNIIEAFSNYQLADASDSSGEWGYKIIGITNGQYGGRSKQEVLSNINSHVKDDYITQSEKDTYSSNGYVNSIIEGQQIGLTDCSYSFGDCMWVDSNNDDIASNEDGQYAKQITNFTAQNYSSNDCPYNAINEIVKYDNLPDNEKNCHTTLPPVNCLYSKNYYHLNDFSKKPYYKYEVIINNRQYGGLTCEEVYGSGFLSNDYYDFTGDPNFNNAKRLITEDESTSLIITPDEPELQGTNKIYTIYEGTFDINNVFKINNGNFTIETSKIGAPLGWNDTIFTISTNLSITYIIKYIILDNNYEFKIDFILDNYTTSCDFNYDYVGISEPVADKIKYTINSTLEPLISNKIYELVSYKGIKENNNIIFNMNYSYMPTIKEDNLIFDMDPNPHYTELALNVDISSSSPIFTIICNDYNPQFNTIFNIDKNELGLTINPNIELFISDLYIDFSELKLSNMCEKLNSELNV